MPNDYRVAFKAACADLGAISALLGFEEFPGVDALLRSITELIAGRKSEQSANEKSGTRLKRSIEQWRRCDPDLMSKQSQAAIFYALKDAKHDILALAADHPGQPEPRAEVTHGDTTMDECMASLLDRLEAAEVYADRYRYLRERPLNAVSVGGVFAGKTPDNVVLNGADLDAAIDAARTGASS